MSPSPNDPIDTLISGPAIEVHVEDTLSRLAELMLEDSIGLVVVRGTEPLAGVVSERDIVRAVAEGADLESDRASDAMATETVRVLGDVTIAEGARLMIEGGMRHLPVIKVDSATNEERVIGVVSIRDLLAVYLD